MSRLGLAFALTLTALPAAAADFKLIVGGTPNLPLEGECTVLTMAAGVEHERIKTTSPRSFSVAARSLSCTLRKTDPFGRIMVTLQQDGRNVAQAETAAAYDWVEVRSAGPWGRASGFRGEPPTTRLAPLTRNRPEAVPPR